jgi:hypothetical protein
MKSLICFSLVAFSFGAFAEDLAVMKQKASSQIDQKISKLQSSKSCINGADSVEKFNACRSDIDQMKMQKMEETTEEMKTEGKKDYESF